MSCKVLKQGVVCTEYTYKHALVPPQLAIFCMPASGSISLTAACLGLHQDFKQFRVSINMHAMLASPAEG